MKTVFTIRSESGAVEQLVSTIKYMLDNMRNVEVAISIEVADASVDANAMLNMSKPALTKEQLVAIGSTKLFSEDGLAYQKSLRGEWEG
jgi:hypothetical protein